MIQPTGPHAETLRAAEGIVIQVTPTPRHYIVRNNGNESIADIAVVEKDPGDPRIVSLWLRKVPQSREARGSLEVVTPPLDIPGIAYRFAVVGEREDGIAPTWTIRLTERLESSEDVVTLLDYVKLSPIPRDVPKPTWSTRIFRWAERSDGGKRLIEEETFQKEPDASILENCLGPTMLGRYDSHGASIEVHEKVEDTTRILERLEYIAGNNGVNEVQTERVVDYRVPSEYIAVRMARLIAHTTPMQPIPVRARQPFEEPKSLNINEFIQTKIEQRNEIRDSSNVTAVGVNSGNPTAPKTVNEIDEEDQK